MPRKAALDALTLFDSLVYTCTYRVAIDPPSAAQAWVMHARHQLRSAIGAFGSFYRLPGIVLVEAELPPEYERPLADAVSRAVAGLPSFSVELGGLAHTADRKCIHVPVRVPEAASVLRARIADHVRANRRIRKLGVEVHDEPRLVVADGLKAAQFEAAWALLQGDAFSGVQPVRDVVLLKRELADTSLDEHVATLPFVRGH
jgi:hypothetical protein